MKIATDLKIPFTWAERRPYLTDRFFYIPTHYLQHSEWTVLPWQDPQLFGNDKPVMVEYGRGNGQWIGDRAKQNPHLNWVAVDKMFDRARKIWLKMHRESISNLLVVYGEAATYTRHYVPAKSVAEIYVNFPDPWPKLRHAKHRLIRKEFLEELLRIVQGGGKATCVTDDAVYSTQMVEEFSQCPEWQPLLPAPFYANEWPDYGKSFFQDLWMRKGRSIYYLPFQRSL